jgi:uncharacterized protein YcbK (DUF882 family)
MLLGIPPALRFATVCPAAAREVPPAALSLYNIHTREGIEVTYRNAAGEYDRPALTALNRLLRCHYTDEVATMDLRVIEFLNAVDKRLGGGREIHVVSGFRSRVYNDWLARHGRGVSPRSLHLVGRAIDVRLPGIGLAAVRQVALGLRRGGVGYYPDSDFVHLDSGRIRVW